MAISLVKEPTGNPSFNLLKKPPQQRQFNIGIDQPPGGMVPLGDTGLWTTPDEPADPQDCERYEGSAFCTAFFFTLTPFSFFPAIAIDECNIGIRADFSMGFIRLPPVAIVYRDPSEACNPPPDVPPPNTNNGSTTPFPFNSCLPTNQSLTLYWISHNEGTERWTIPEGLPFPTDTPGEYISEDTSNINVTLIEFPYTGADYPIRTRNGQLWNPLINLVRAKIHYTTTYTYSVSAAYRSRFYGANDDRPLTDSKTLSKVAYIESGDYIVNIEGDGALPLKNSLFAMLSSTIQAKAYLDTHPVAIGRFNFSSSPIFTLINVDASASEALFNEDRPERKYRTKKATWDIKVVCGTPTNRNNPPPPPNDNPPPRHCCMSCCPSQSQQDNSLLALLMQKVDKLSNIVGVDEYPISLPPSLISKDEGFFGNLIPNDNVDIPNLTVFFAWYIERFDEIMGQWEIPIEVKDTDPTKPGDQPVGFKLPNMAEAIAEMFGLMLQTSTNTQIAINMQTRTMLEVGQNKQQGFKSYMLVLAIADHLGFDYKEVKHKIPMLFDITQTQLDKLLVESEIEVSAVDYTDKEDLKIVLLELRQAAAIIKAVHWRKFDVKSDIAKGVKDLIMGLVATSDEVNDNKKDEEDGKDKFDDFLEDAEVGFTTSSGITDTDHPYGRNYNERPRIKEIGHESPGV